MTRSLRSSFVFTVAMVSFGAFGHAQIRTLPLPKRGLVYSVKLTATPGPSGVALATTVYSRPWDSTASAPWNLFTSDGLRYTFSAQRTWPGVCSDSKPIATSDLTHGQRTVNNLPGGKYTSFSVDVTGMSPLPSTIGHASTTVATYTVQPTGSGVNTTWDVNPPSGSHGPVLVYITNKINFPAEGTTYLFRIHCGPGCQPSEGSSSQNPYTLPTTISPGSPRLDAYINAIHVGNQYGPDCTWLASWSVSKFDYSVAP